MRNIIPLVVGGAAVVVLAIVIGANVAETRTSHLAATPTSVQIQTPPLDIHSSSSTQASSIASSTQHFRNKSIAFDFPAQWTFSLEQSGNKQSDYPPTFPYHDGGSVELAHVGEQSGNVNRYIGDVQLLDFTSGMALDEYISDRLIKTLSPETTMGKLTIGGRTAFQQYHASGNPKVHSSIQLFFPMGNKLNTLTEVSVFWLPVSSSSAIVANEFVTTVAATLHE